MARILIVGGGCRGRRLAEAFAAEGHAVRVTTRSEAGRAEIEASGAECWIGTPDRLATLGGALASATIACWLLGTARGESTELDALHGSRLESFLALSIDTTVRGFVYEAAGSIAPPLLLRGRRAVEALTRRNAIPVAFLTADPGDRRAWQAQASSAVASLLDPR